MKAATLPTVEQIWGSLDLDLPTACRELLERNRTGILPEGAIRTLERALATAGYPTTMTLRIAERHVQDLAVAEITQGRRTRWWWGSVCSAHQNPEPQTCARCRSGCWMCHAHGRSECAVCDRGA